MKSYQSNIFTWPISYLLPTPGGAPPRRLCRLLLASPSCIFVYNTKHRIGCTDYDWEAALFATRFLIRDPICQIWDIARSLLALAARRYSTCLSLAGSYARDRLGLLLGVFLWWLALMEKSFCFVGNRCSLWIFDLISCGKERNTLDFTG